MGVETRPSPLERGAERSEVGCVPLRTGIAIAHFVLLLLLVTLPARAQNAQVLGRVTSAATGEALMGVHVTLEQDRVMVAGAVSDADGRYAMRGLAAGSYALAARHIGYREVHLVVVLGAAPVVVDVRLEVGVVGLDEVEVGAEAEQAADDVRVGLSRLSPREARQLAGGGEDVMRALQTLPGVLSASDYANQLIVRGGTPDQNLILLDDIEVFSPYQLHGMSSLLNPAMIRTVELYAGAFPAPYGDRLSSVLAVQTREGRSDTWLGGQVGANLANLNAVLEGRTGFWDGSWLVSGRRTYFDSFANTFARRLNIFNKLALPDFYDAQVKLAFQPARAHRLRLTGLFSHDVLNWGAGQDAFGRQGDGDNLQGGASRSRNTALGLTWTYAPHQALQLSLFANLYQNRGGRVLSGGLTPRDGAFGARVTEPPPPVFGRADTARFTYDQAYRLRKGSVGGRGTSVRGRHTLEAGGGVDWLGNRLDAGVALNDFGTLVFEALQAVNPQVGALADTLHEVKTYRRVQGYVQDKVAFGRRLFVQPGLRFDVYEITGTAHLSPRLSFSLVVDSLTTLRLAGGRYRQSPGFEKLLDRDNALTLARFRSLDSLDAEAAWHLGAGLTRRLGTAWQVRVDGYLKRLDDLLVQTTRVVQRPVAQYQPQNSGSGGRVGRVDPEAYQITTRDVLEQTTTPVNDGSGKAYGLELLVEKRSAGRWAPWSGWLSYAYARAERTQTIDGKTVTVPFDYDRRHTFNLMLNRQVGAHVAVGLTWRYGAGFPYTPPVSMEALVAIVDDPVTGAERGIMLTDPDTGYARLVPGYGGAENVNAGRLPAYHRLDLRLTYKTGWRGAGLTVYLDLINVYNRKNVVEYQYVVEVEAIEGVLPGAIRPPAEPLLYREPVYMFPFIPSLGFNVSF